MIGPRFVVAESPHVLLVVPCMTIPSQGGHVKGSFPGIYWPRDSGFLMGRDGSKGEVHGDCPLWCLDRRSRWWEDGTLLSFTDLPKRTSRHQPLLMTSIKPPRQCFSIIQVLEPDSCGITFLLWRYKGWRRVGGGR